MKNISLIIVAFFAFIIIGCKGEKHQHHPSTEVDDTIYTEKAVLKIYSTKPRLALELIDSGVAYGYIDPFVANFLRAKVYSEPTDIVNRDTARQICVNLLANDSVKENLDLKFSVLDQLRNIAYMQNDDADILLWSTQLIDVCRAQNDTTNELRTQADIGRTLTRIGQYDKGIQMLDDVINRLDRVKRFSELDACIIAMRRKVLVLIDNNQMSEAVALTRRIIEKCDDYEQHPDVYADGSFRQPDSDEIKQYCDFYRTRAYCNAAKASALSGRLDDARRYAQLFEETDYGRTVNARMLIAPTWVKLGKYDKMFLVYDEAVKRMGADTINEDYQEILKNRAIAADALHNYEESQNLWLRHDKLSKQLSDSLLTSKAHSFAARYRAQEQQEQIKRHEIESKHKSMALALGVTFAVIAVILAIYFYYQKRALMNKNRIIIEQSSEAMEFKAKYIELISAKENEETPAVTGQNAEQQADDKPRRDPRSMSGEELFEYLRYAIVNERLYLKPDFSRQTVVDHFSVTARMVGAAFAQNSKFGSLPNFIRECRLQYACHLLVEHPEKTVSDIATESGFSHLAAFSRAFKDKYSLSPSEYRAHSRSNQ